MSFLLAAGAFLLDGDDLFAGDGRARLGRIQADYGQLFTHVGFVVSLEAGSAFAGFHDGNAEQTAAIHYYSNNPIHHATSLVRP